MLLLSQDRREPSRVKVATQKNYFFDLSTPEKRVLFFKKYVKTLEKKIK